MAEDTVRLGGVFVGEAFWVMRPGKVGNLLCGLVGLLESLCAVLFEGDIACGGIVGGRLAFAI